MEVSFALTVGGENVRTYCDGIAECQFCHKEFTYWKM